VQRLSFVAGDNILTAVSVARDCGMVLPYEQVIQITVKVDLHRTDIHWEVVGVPQALSHGSFRSDSVSPIVTLLEPYFCISIM
jgi:magnesium-transporting ATPase (P-type)